MKNIFHLKVRYVLDIDVDKKKIICTVTMAVVILSLGLYKVTSASYPPPGDNKAEETKPSSALPLQEKRWLKTSPFQVL